MQKLNSYKEKLSFFGTIGFFLLLGFLFNEQLLAQKDTIFNANTIAKDKLKVYKIGLPIVPGLMYRDTKGAAKGFPIEIIEHILKKEKINYVWVEGSWNELFNKLISAEIDVLPGIQITDEREKILDYVQAYLYTQWSELYIQKDINFEYIEDLYQQKIGLIKGDNNATGFRKYFDRFNIEYTAVVIDSHKEAMDMLRAGKLFAMAGPSPNSLGDELVDIKSSGIYYNPVNNSYAIPKGKNKYLSSIIANNINKLKADPTSVYYRLLDKYDLTTYRDKKYKVPQWIQLSMIISAFLIVISIVFILLLRSQVNRKTQIISERESLLREAMEIGEIGAWVYHFKTEELYWSDEIYFIAGLNRKKVKINIDLMKSIVHPEDQRNAIVYPNPLIKEDEKIENEYRLMKKNGEIIHVNQIATIEKDEKGVAKRILGVIQNISQQRRYEQDLIKAKEKAEKSEKLKSAFLANMSHEIRTPLNSIIGFSSLLAEDGFTSEQKKGYRTIIHKQNDLLLTLINDILDLSKIESGNMAIRPQDVSPVELIDEIYSNFTHQCPSEIEFTKNYNNLDNNSVVRADPKRLSQILINFASNAFKYTKMGKIEIGCIFEIKSSGVKLYVKDTGIGLTTKEQNKIFAPFKQIDHMTQGTGLGLSISKSLAHLMNMKISVNSTKNKGSEFYIMIKNNKNQDTTKNHKKKSDLFI